VQVTIDVQSAMAISRAWLRAPAMVMEELETAMGASVVYLQGQVADRSKVRPDGLNGAASGLLASSFVHDVTSFADAVFGRVSSPLTYALPVELGTRPHFPPMAPLINWVEQKLGLYGEEAEGAARGIQRKIGHHGSVGRYMARDAVAFGAAEVVQKFADAAERITARLADAGTGGAA
jgi:hypothetical protein